MKTNYVFLIAFTAFTFFCSQVTKASVSGPDSLPKIDNSQSMLAVSSSHHGGHGGGGDKNFSAGGQLSYSAYLGDAPFHMIGLGINGEYFAGKYAFRFLFNYNFSYTTPTAISVISQSNYTPPYYMGSTLDSTVTATDVVGLMTLGFDVKKVFGSRDYSDGGFYGFAGLGLSLATETITPNSYNTSDWVPAVSDETGTQTFTQFNIRLGLGYDAKLSFGTMFGEAILILPANSVNGVSVDINIPTAVGIQAGVRIPLF